MKIKQKIELLAPVGDFATLRAVIEAGADAVYLGLKTLNMRASAKNFSYDDLKKAVEYSHCHNVKVYVTVNTIIYENELKELEKHLIAIKNSKADAIIAWDFAVIQMANKLKIPVHISTQASIANSERLNFYKKFATRFVLARELDLNQIKQIIKKTKADVEVFGHGAMCVSQSGRCFISQFLYGKSANRGECIQPCRREYKITDPETGKELVLENNFVMSPKDLCTLPFVDILINIGVSSLKIEGRTRSPEYSKVVVTCYRKTIDAVYNKTFTDEFVSKLLDELSTVYNKKMSSGFFLGLPTNEDWSDLYGSAATTKKLELGYVNNYFKKTQIAEVKVQANNIKVGDDIHIQGPTTGVIDFKLKELVQDYKKVEESHKGKSVTFQIPTILRKNDRVYKIINVEQKNKDDYKSIVRERLAKYKLIQ
ncbi:MAG: peptidase U32 family protein [Candidatus Woesearchaeota archaeon]|jgi:putative protease